MTISAGDRLPDAELLTFDGEAPGTVSVADKAKGKRMLLVGMPGAFTRTCSAMHMPSLVERADEIREKGVDVIAVFVVNDPFVAHAWSAATNADRAGIEVWADSDGAFTRNLGLAFDAAPVGFQGRARRSAMVVQDGEVERIELEDGAGDCDITGGRRVLEML